MVLCRATSHVMSICRVNGSDTPTDYGFLGNPTRAELFPLFGVSSSLWGVLRGG